MKVLQICAYAAPYEGNFMQSLFALERRLHEFNITIIYAFPENARDIPWCKALSLRTAVYYLPLFRAQFSLETYYLLYEIFKENPDIGIVHSHFEQYDTPAALTAPKGVKVFWHLHDPIAYAKSLKGFLMKIKYKYVGRRARLISVSEKYRRDIVSLGFKEAQSHTLLNGICLDRVKYCGFEKPREYDFVTFGWDFYRKGDDIILTACNRLKAEGYRFRLLLNGLEPTWKALDEYCNGKIPEYLVMGHPESDINDVLSKSSVYISASRRETFSYAIGEAAYAGLSVISSDIPGVEWAHDLPTVEYFESENADSLYRVLKEYLDGKTVAEEKIDRTREIIEKKYSASTWAERIVECYGLQ